MRCRRIITAALLLLLGAAAPVDDRYVLDDTHVVTWQSKDHARTLRLLIALPRHFEARSQSFPVIYLLDADYSFAITRNVLRHFTDRDQLQEAVIVGIAYPGAEEDLKIYQRNRVHDYTPVRAGGSGYGDDIDAQAGGAPDFLKLLGDDLLPAIDARYHTDPNARMLVGHSYGGLFTTYAMLTRPDLFRDYIVVSPSYWFDDKMIFALARNYIAGHGALAAHVFYGVGAFEGGGTYESGGTMADDMKAMDSLLTGAKLKGYESSLRVFTGETHNSVFPAAVTRGLRTLYGFAGEDKPVVAPHS
jgi:predicted alpha/beta superfamily hydrolase